MKRGINIGDHFENDRVELFINPVQDWYYEKITQLGFDHVRLPARWTEWTDKDNGYKIDDNFFNIYVSVVDKLLERGLEVIVNVHHFREAMDNPIGNEEQLLAIWEQLSERFKDYPDALIFEIMNEPTWRATCDDWNKVQMDCYELIRKTNPTRRIEFCGVDYSGLIALDNLKIPENDKNIIVTFHFYFPVNFTHQGAPWAPTFKDVTGIRWGDEEDDYEQVMALLIAHAKNFSRTHGGCEMNLGEFGVYSAAAPECRYKWTRCVRESCEKLGISWTYWELNRNFGIFDRLGNPKQGLIDSLLN